MTVVSNTSPLNYLILIGHADILSKLYEAVEIPRAVFDELQDRRSPGLVRKWMKDPPTWLRVSITVHKLDAELEQIQIGEKAIVTIVASHIAGREDVNQKADESNEQRVDAAQTIHCQAEVGAECSNLNPSPEVVHDRLHRSQR